MPGGKQTLRSFIVDWKEHYAKVHDLDFASLTSMLRAIDRDFGSYTLDTRNASLQIELAERPCPPASLGGQHLEPLLRGV